MVLWLRFMWAGSGAPNYQTINKMIDKRMKKIAIALAGVALCLGACQQDGKTEVTLKLKDGQKAPAAIMGVNLTDTLSSERDSLTYYTGAADTLVGVIDLGNNEYWTVVLDGTPVELDFSGETPVLVKGSQTNKLMTEVHLEMSKIEENIKAITDTEYRALAEKYNNDIPDSLMSNLEARYDKAIEDYKAFLTKNIEANKDNVIAAFLLMKSGGMLSVEFEESFLENYPYKNLSMLAPIYAEIQGEKNKVVGAPLADFEMNDMDGKAHRLSDFVGKGQYTLVDFWASWCGPCRAEMPNVKACYEKYKDKGFSIVGISFDQDLQAWKDATTQLGITWPQLSDLKGWQCKAAEVYYIRSIPSTILFSPDGKVIATNLRGDELGDKLAELLDK